MATEKQATNPQDPQNQQNVADELIAKEAAREKKMKRTVGLKILDNLFYTVLNNTAVFFVSVAATYITQNKNRTYTDPIRAWLQGRGGKFIHWATNPNVFSKKGFGLQTAENASMVAFSFIDGSVMAPAVKVLEDHRESLAQKIDYVLGTVPEDKTVYDAEPKQSWGSILMGRLSALAVVLPVAVTLGKVGKDHNNQWGVKDKEIHKEGGKPFRDINAMWFREPGVKIGNKLKENFPWISKRFTNTELLFRTTIFEGVYTSICTAGLYVGSRFFASHKDIAKLHHNPKNTPRPTPTPAPIATSDIATTAPVIPDTVSSIDTKAPAPATVDNDNAPANSAPSPKVANIKHADRIENLPAHAVGA